MPKDLLTEITASVVGCDPDATVALIRQALDGGFEPMRIVQGGLVPGMDKVGAKFSSGEYYLPQLVVAARCMQTAMEVLQPRLVGQSQALKPAGTVVIGTVFGDIHEIGKSLVATLLYASGFQVHDLGVNVPTDEFVATVRKTEANLVGLSALLTTTMSGQRDVIQALKRAGLRDRVRVMVGGAPVTQQWCDAIDADGYAQDAVAAVSLARRLAT